MTAEQLQLMNQCSETLSMEQFVLEEGELLLFRNIFSKEQAQDYFNKLKSGLSWRQDTLNFGGKRIAIPRLQAWYGDEDARYRYSGLALNPLSWTPELLQIKAEVEALSETRFNSALANLYRSGSDSVAWHQDNEPELGRNPVIGSVSLGAARVFQLKHKRYKRGNTHLRFTIELPDNSLLVMKGPLQHYWYHQIPKTPVPVGERINLTFRKIISAHETNAF